ncbi:ERV/ALR sulfhydryl oxidase domain-containing protein [Fimicolochytrium jonesii]|uniref:ERV/ALR sulfhydryl oxidase domain-containing protein n=1 Tax=Fimicolochytrium jonesii TaxID=1396493 RepID=UPI0022FF293B|nr:ERV/ALR sulfhydryl oxidase domain-containing protein [Fimicolochytrium jonesii]KAI8820881.1 ERV/ALR sulfhydryl oxidase domain-containing protein [Fimicolochytrium jonesii]
MPTIRPTYTLLALLACTVFILTLAAFSQNSSALSALSTRSSSFALSNNIPKVPNAANKLGTVLSGRIGAGQLQAVRKPGAVIMSKMGNETLKAELGRAAWRVLHTMAGKFPEEPTEDEQTAMRDYIYLFARLYPCGDCARHFAQILTALPPDVTSRATISQWACQAHNKVNERLGKAVFDCVRVNEEWKCGCAEELGGAGDGKTMTVVEKDAVKPTG